MCVEGYCAHCFKEGNFPHFLKEYFPFSKYSPNENVISQVWCPPWSHGIISPRVARMHYDAMPLCLKSMLPPGAVSLEQILLTRQNKGIPMTTKLRSCFPPCRFSSSAFTSICCLSLPDFLTDVGVELSSSDAWMEGGRNADLWALVSSTLGEAMLPSSPGGPLWGVCRLSPFSSGVKLQKEDQKKMSGNLFNCCPTVSEHRDASFYNSLHFGSQLSDSSLLR